MADEKQALLVTRAEFYTVVGGVYSLIALALLGVLRREESVLTVIGYSIAALAALFMSFSFSIYALRERRRQKRENAELAEADQPTV